MSATKSKINMNSKKVETPPVVKEKPKKRSLVERELETTLSPQFISPASVDDGSSASRYGRARRIKTDTDFCDTAKAVARVMQSSTLTKLPVKSPPAYKMHASNSQVTESPKTTKTVENKLDDQIVNIYNTNISLSRFGSEENKETPSSVRKSSKVYIRKDLIQTKEKEETVTLIKNIFSPAKSAKKSNSHLKNVLERSSEKYDIDSHVSKPQNGYLDTSSVVKTLDFDSKKKKSGKEKEETKNTLSKSDLFEMEAKCAYQVGDIAWARMGTFPFWPCIVTREPGSDLFMKKKLFGKIERDIIHVTFFADNGRRSWIVDTMLRKYQGLQEFEATRDQFTSEKKKKDPRLYAAFFISDKKLALWHTAIEEADMLLREPKRLRIDILNDMLTSLKIKCTPSKIPKGGRITRTDSDVSLSESLFDTLFSEDDGSLLTPQKQRKKSLDVSEVVTACLDNMAAKTGLPKIQKQSHMDIWLQKAKSKTPEKSQFSVSITVERMEKENDNKEKFKKDKDTGNSSVSKKKRWVPPKEPLHKPYTFRKSTESQHLFYLQNEHDYSKNANTDTANNDINEYAHSELEHENFTQSDHSICVIEKIESLRTENDLENNIITTEVHDDFLENVDSQGEIHEVDSVAKAVEQNINKNKENEVKFQENNSIQDVLKTSVFRTSSSKRELTKPAPAISLVTENSTIKEQNLSNVNPEEKKDSISPPKKRILRSHKNNAHKDPLKPIVTHVKQKNCENSAENKESSENTICLTENTSVKNKEDLNKNTQLNSEICNIDKVSEETPETDKALQDKTADLQEKTQQSHAFSQTFKDSPENDVSKIGLSQNPPKKRILRLHRTFARSKLASLDSPKEALIVEEKVDKETHNKHNERQNDENKSKALKVIENEAADKSAEEIKNKECCDNEVNISLKKNSETSMMQIEPSNSKGNSSSLRQDQENSTHSKQNHVIITDTKVVLSPSIPKRRTLRIHKTLLGKNALKLEVSPLKLSKADVDKKTVKNAQENNLISNCSVIIAENVQITNKVDSCKKDQSETETDKHTKNKSSEIEPLSQQKTPVPKENQSSSKQLNDIPQKIDEHCERDVVSTSTPKQRIIRMKRTSLRTSNASPLGSKSPVNISKNNKKSEPTLKENIISIDDHMQEGEVKKKDQNVPELNDKPIEDKKFQQHLPNTIHNADNIQEIPKNKTISQEENVKSNKEQNGTIVEINSMNNDLQNGSPKKSSIYLNKILSPKGPLIIKVSPVKAKFRVIDIDKCLDMEVNKSSEKPLNIGIETPECIDKNLEKSKEISVVIENVCEKSLDQVKEKDFCDSSEAGLSISIDDDRTSCNSNQVSESLLRNAIIEQNEIIQITEELATPITTNIGNISVVNISNDLNNIITDDDKTSCSSRQVGESVSQTPVNDLDEIMEVTEYLVTPSGILEENDSFEKPKKLLETTMTKDMKLKTMQEMVKMVEQAGEVVTTDPDKCALNDNFDVTNMPIIIDSIDNDISTNIKSCAPQITESLQINNVDIEKNCDINDLLNSSTPKEVANKMPEKSPSESKEILNVLSSSKLETDVTILKECNKDLSGASEIASDLENEVNDAKAVEYPIENSIYDSISLRSEISSLTNYNDNTDKDFDPDNVSITSLSSEISNISGFQPRITRVRSLSMRENETIFCNNTDKPDHASPDSENESVSSLDEISLLERRTKTKRSIPKITYSSDNTMDSITSTDKPDHASPDSDNESVSSLDEISLLERRTKTKRRIPKITYSSENTMDCITSDAAEKSLRLVLTDCLLEQKVAKLPSVKKISTKTDVEHEFSNTASAESTPRRLSLRSKKELDFSSTESALKQLTTESSTDLKSPAQNVQTNKKEGLKSSDLKTPPQNSKSVLVSSPSVTELVTAKTTPKSSKKHDSLKNMSSDITPKKPKHSQQKLTDIWSISPPAQSNSSSPNSGTKVSPKIVLKKVSKDVVVMEKPESKMNGYHDSRPSSPDFQVKEQDFDTISIKSTDSNTSVKRKGKRLEHEPMKEPEFLNYLELRQDTLMDEHPELTYEEIVAYLYKTWQYEENRKSDIKKTDETESCSVKGVNNQENSFSKKKKKPLILNIRKIMTKETFKKTPTIDEVKPRELPKRKASKPFYCEDLSDIEDEIEMFEIFKKSTLTTPKVEPKQEQTLENCAEAKRAELTSHDNAIVPSKSPKIEQAYEKTKEGVAVIEEDFVDDYYDEEELYFEQLTKPKPNVFKGMIREKVCEICETTHNLVKCKGCNGMFHVDCVNKVVEVVETPAPTRGRKKKIKNRGRGFKPKASLESNEESHSDDKSYDPNNSSENMSFEEAKEHVPIVIPDADDFETKLEAKMKEIIDLTSVEYDSYSSDDGIDWSETVAGKCEIVDVKLKPRSQPVLTDYSDFKCRNCQENDTPICFVCKSAVSPKIKTQMRQKCQVAHCHKFYHLECLEHWPQTQFNAGEFSRSNKKIDEYFEPLTCPRHVCHTCVCDDPRGCKTRFSGDKLARCVRCPATYHSFTKCLPAGSQILSASHIVCPRHYEHRPGKVPYHVNTGWCFICALGGNLICCDYCPTSFHADCLNIEPPEGGYMCEDCETGRLPLYGEMVWVKLGHYRWWPGLILHPSEIPENIMAVKHTPGEFVVRFFGQYDHYWVNRGRVFPFQEGDSGKVSTQKSKIDEAFTKAMEHAQRAFEILKNVEPNDEENQDIASSLLPPHYVKLKVNKPCGALYGKKVDIEESSLTPCECNPDEEDPCGPYSHCLNRMLLTECGPTCRAGERCQNRQFEKREYPKLVPYRTSHRGWGLMTLEDIRAGQFVIEYVGELIDEAEFRRRMRRKHETRDENFYFLILDKERMIDAGPKGNLARFMNHCCEPNCETQKWTVLGDIRVGLFAINDIPANTEVTFNYNLECNGIEKKQCMCGARRCAGYIGAKPKQEEPQPKKTKRTYKKRKNVDSPSTSTANQNNKPKRPIGRPPKPKEPPRELTEIEKDLLIIKNATNGLSSDSDGSGRLSSIDDQEKKESKALKRKRVSFSTEELVFNGASPNVKRLKIDEEKSDKVGD